MTWLLDNRPLRSILVSRLRYLGDIVMSTVVLEALKAGDPDLELAYLCERAHGAVLAGEESIDRLHLLGAARSGADAAARQSHAAADGPTGRGTLAMIRELRRADYDLAVDLFFNPRSAWLLWLGGCRARIGGTTGSRRRLYTHTVVAAEVRRQVPDLDKWAPGGLGDHLARLAPLRHAESNLDFMTWIAGYLGDRQLCPRLTFRPQGDAQPYLLLAPGATWASKAWPRERWRGLVEELAGADNPPLRILVPPGRQEEFAFLAENLPPDRVEILPPAGLATVKHHLSGAAAVVTVDGGVMHMAVALGRPTVALFGPTDPAIWFPYQAAGPYRVLATAPSCHPCDLHQCDAFVCLPELSMPSVVAALRDLLARPAAAVSHE